MTRIFIRNTSSRKDYDALYEILKSYLRVKFKDVYVKEYVSIEWDKIFSEKTLKKANEEATSLNSVEKDAILNKTFVQISFQRFENLRSLFFILSKVSADEDFLSEFVNKN